MDNEQKFEFYMRNIFLSKQSKRELEYSHTNEFGADIKDKSFEDEPRFFLKEVGR